MIKFQTIIFNTILLLMLLLKVQNKNAGFYTILFWILQTENSEKKRPLSSSHEESDKDRKSTVFIQFMDVFNDS